MSDFELIEKTSVPSKKASADYREIDKVLAEAYKENKAVKMPKKFRGQVSHRAYILLSSMGVSASEAHDLIHVIQRKEHVYAWFEPLSSERNKK